MNKELKSRPPAVSGIFYPSNPFELQKSLEQSFLDKNFGPGECRHPSITRKYME